MSVVAATGFSYSFAAPPSATVDSDVMVNVDEVISLSIIGCNTTPEEDVKLTAAVLRNGSFSSCPLNAIVSTNAPGFKLSIQGVDTPTFGPESTTNPYWDGANDGNLKLVRTYIDGIEQIDTTNTIDPHTGTTVAPSAMTSATTSVWGFAVPKAVGTGGQSTANNAIGLTLTNFDNTYSTISQSDTLTTGLYAAVPTTVIQIKDYPNFSTIPNQTTVFFGTRVKGTQQPGSYKGVVLFSTTSNEVPPVPAAP